MINPINIIVLNHSSSSKLGSRCRVLAELKLYSQDRLVK